MSQVRHRATRAPRRTLFRRLGQRGAVAVEAAIVFPLLIVLTFGIVEFSMLMKDVTAAASLTRTGARTASAEPRKASFIDDTVAAMEKAASAMPKDSFEELWIYRANDDGFPMGQSSMASCTNECVRYAWVDGPSGDPAFEPVGGTWNHLSINACPADKNAMAVGVYLKAKHKWITGLFFDTTIVDDRAVMKFEPIASIGGTVQCKP